MSKDKECINLGDIRKEYIKFKEKYNLPEFTKLNEYFDIEELGECETEFLLRKIRKIISEKTAGYLRFFETLLNPNNTPIFIFKLIKKINEEDKRQLSEIYETLGRFELETVELDLDYNESKEAEFIKKACDIMNKELSRKLLDIIEKMNDNNKSGEEKDKVSYFG